MGLDIFITKHSRIGYFSKVNFLVKYFSDLGFDVDNKTPFPISKEDVEILLSRCKEVIKDHNKAQELLPTMDGFFFGSTSYDEQYFEDVEDVKVYLEETLIPEFDYLNERDVIFFEIWY